MKTFLQWITEDKIREDKFRTAMAGVYPDAYAAHELPPLAVTPRSSHAAFAYTHQYKHLLQNLRGAKKGKKKKK